MSTRITTYITTYITTHVYENHFIASLRYRCELQLTLQHMSTRTTLSQAEIVWLCQTLAAVFCRRRRACDTDVNYKRDCKLRHYVHKNYKRDCNICLRELQEGDYKLRLREPLHCKRRLFDFVKHSQPPSVEDAVLAMQMWITTYTTTMSGIIIVYRTTSNIECLVTEHK